MSLAKAIERAESALEFNLGKLTPADVRTLVHAAKRVQELKRRIRLARKLVPLVGWGRTADEVHDVLDLRKPLPKGGKRR